MSDLYERDILEWSVQQAGLLRQLAAGQRANEAPDWGNLIEEIESVGRSQLMSVRSLLVQAMLHDLKVMAWPDSREVPHWQSEARGFRDDAAAAFSPSMRQWIDVVALFLRAVRRLPGSIDGQPPLPVPQACPYTLDDLLNEDAP